MRKGSNRILNEFQIGPCHFGAERVTGAMVRQQYFSSSAVRLISAIIADTCRHLLLVGEDGETVLEEFSEV